MIDLHTHTVYSDGADTPEQVLDRAQALHLSTLAITDHNTIKAYEDPAMEHLHDHFKGALIPGVEITCMFEGGVVEVLGYGFDRKKMQEELSKYVLSFHDKQMEEYRLILEAYRKAGAILDESQIHFDPDHESSRRAILRELNRHVENRALFLNSEDAGSSRGFTRGEVYNPQSPLYVDEASLYPSVPQAVKMIHDAGGIAFLAHLYEYANADELFGRMEDIVKETKLDGLECRHNCFSPEDARRLEAFCDTHHLLKSGGSDYHGSRKPHVIMGNPPGMQIDESFLQDWPKRILDQAL